MVRENEIQRVNELLGQYPKGLTIEDVSQKLSMNRGTAAKYLNLLVASGQAEMRSLGPAKLFTHTHRVPVSQLINFTSDLILILDGELFIRQVNDALLTYFGIERDAILDTQIQHSPLARHLTRHHLDRIRTVLESDAKVIEEVIDLEDYPGTLPVKFLPLILEQGERGIAIILTSPPATAGVSQDLERIVEEHTRELAEVAREYEERIKNLQKTRNSAVETEERCREILDTLPVAVFTLNDEGIITSVTPAAGSISGHDPAQLPGHLFEDYVYPQDLIAFTQGLDKNRQGSSSPFEFRIMTKEDGPHWVQVSGRTVSRQGIPGGFQGVLIDIHERKRIEKTLRQANKQLVLLNSITRHDILNAITKLLAYLELAQRQTKSIVVAEILEKEKVIITTIQRQITFTRDYQNIGIRPPLWKDVRESIEAAKLGLDLEKIAVHIDIPDIEIFADDLVDKVFLNLMDNSIQHGDGVTLIRFSIEYQEKTLLLICEDDGKGIPDEEKDLVFEHSRGGQTHYGLFFSREILAITGLSIREDGIPGVGARFEITVPDGMFRSK